MEKREIKFRFWGYEYNDKSGRHGMHLPEHHCLHIDASDGSAYRCTGSSVYGDGWDIYGETEEQKLLTPMQFIGRKDKNNADIYEGDIIRTVNGDVGAVVYVAPTFEVTISPDQSCSYSREWWDKCEVIGNIYEHPHLLSGGN